MRALDVKLLRDLRRIWAQTLAIALVLGCGIMVLVLAQGAERALTQTRDAYYERNRFAHVFAGATRAPNLAPPAEIRPDWIRPRIDQGYCTRVVLKNENEYALTCGLGRGLRKHSVSIMEVEEGVFSE